MTDTETRYRYRAALFDAVEKQIVVDVLCKDTTAIHELIQHIPETFLEGYLYEFTQNTQSHGGHS